MEAPEPGTPKRLARVKKWLFPLLRFAITAGVLFVLFSQYDLKWEDWKHWAPGAGKWIWLGLITTGVSMAFGIARWKTFLDIQRIHLSWKACTIYGMIGNFFNLFLLGAVGGDAVKIYLLVNEKGVSRASAFVSILMDRLSGLVALAIVTGAVVVWRYEWFSSDPQAKTMLFFLVGFLVLIIFGVVFSFTLAGMGLAEKAPSYVPFRKQWGAFCEAYLVFAESWKRSVWGCVLALVVQISYFAAYACAGKAISEVAKFWDLFSMMPIVDTIASMPISISGIGVREKVFETLSTSLTSIDGGDAIRLSLFGFGFFVLWGMLGGLIFLFRRREEGLREVLKKAGEEN